MANKDTQILDTRRTPTPLPLTARRQDHTLVTVHLHHRDLVMEVRTGIPLVFHPMVQRPATLTLQDLRQEMEATPLHPHQGHLTEVPEAPTMLPVGERPTRPPTSRRIRPITAEAAVVPPQRKQKRAVHIRRCRTRSPHLQARLLTTFLPTTVVPVLHPAMRDTRRTTPRRTQLQRLRRAILDRHRPRTQRPALLLPTTVHPEATDRATQRLTMLHRATVLRLKRGPVTGRQVPRRIPKQRALPRPTVHRVTPVNATLPHPCQQAAMLATPHLPTLQQATPILFLCQRQT